MKCKYQYFEASKISLFVFLITSVLSFGQSPNYEWVKNSGGTGSDNINKLTTDNMGYIYVTGEFSDTANIGGTTMIVTGSFASDRDAFIAKMDSIGNTIWINQIGGDGLQTIGGVGTDDASNVFVTGIFNQPITIGSTSLIPTGDTELDFYIAKIDSSGNILWAFSEGDVGKDVTCDLTIDASGNILVSGYFSGSVQIGNTFLNNEGQYDIFIAKYSNDGDPIWSISAGGTTSDYGYGVATDNQGDVYVAGGYGSYGFPAYFGTDTITPVGGMDAFLAKYDSNGNFIWVRSGGGDGYSGGGWGDKASSVCVSDNAIYSTGIFWETAYFENDSISSAGMGDMFISKYDLNGNLHYLIADGGINGVQGNDIACDEGGNIYTTGNFYGIAQFGETTLVNTGILSYMFTVKYDSTGAFKWVKQAGLPVNQNGIRGYTIDTYKDRVYVGGLFQDSASFDNQVYCTFGWFDAYIACIKQYTNPNIIPKLNNPMINLYPNPTYKGFTIMIGSEQQNKLSNIDVKNDLGVLMEQKKIFPDQNIYYFDSNGYKNGIYMVIIYGEQISILKKLILLRN